jgi:hypothetical protein
VAKRAHDAPVLGPSDLDNEWGTTVAERLGGFDQDEIHHGFEALLSARNRSGVERAVEELPVLRAPVFHAFFRQHMLRAQSERPDWHAAVEPLYDDFFYVLHERAYMHLAAACRPERPPIDVPPTFAPEFFLRLADRLGGNLPTANGPTYDPADSVGLANELCALAGPGVDVPAYAPTPGSRWAAVLVRCPVCQSSRLDLRAHFVDLTEAPDLADPLRTGSVNLAPCPKCGCAVRLPQRVWVTESPEPADSLAALSCLWILGETFECYQPPPGTTRVPNLDRVLECRFNKLQRDLAAADRPKRIAREGASALIPESGRLRRPGVGRLPRPGGLP